MDNDVYRLHECRIPGGDEPLFARLSEAIPGLSRRQAREAILAGLVQVSGTVASDPNETLTKNSKVVVDLRQGIKKVRLAQRAGSATGTEIAPFTILHDDGSLLVVNKTAGILSAPGFQGQRGHVAELIRQQWKRIGREGAFIGQVHRLDQDTSGCLCFGLTRDAQKMLSAQFAGGAATRKYRALVGGHLAEKEGTLRSRLARGGDGRRAVVDDDTPGKEAITHWKVLRRYGPLSDIEIQLETGRTHQIRVHLAEQGAPLLGDRIYARQLPPYMPVAPRLMLHAESLALDHPRTGERITLHAPVPPEFQAVIEEARSTRPDRNADGTRKPFVRPDQPVEDQQEDEDEDEDGIQRTGRNNRGRVYGGSNSDRFHQSDDRIERKARNVKKVSTHRGQGARPAAEKNDDEDFSHIDIDHYDPDRDDQPRQTKKSGSTVRAPKGVKNERKPQADNERKPQVNKSASAFTLGARKNKDDIKPTRRLDSAEKAKPDAKAALKYKGKTPIEGKGKPTPITGKPASFTAKPGTKAKPGAKAKPDGKAKAKPLIIKRVPTPRPPNP